PAVLHPLQLHERVAADRVERVPALPVGPTGRLRRRSLHLALVQGSAGHPRASLVTLRRLEAAPPPAGRRRPRLLNRPGSEVPPTRPRVGLVRRGPPVCDGDARRLPTLRRYP